MSRTARWLLLVVSLVVIVAAGVYAVLAREDDPGGGGELTVVRGLVGSEKAPFFHDPKVQQAFEDRGYRLEIDTAGSRSMLAAIEREPDGYDFYFPSSAPVADEMGTRLPGSTQTPVFQTPLVVLTFTDVEAILRANGLARPGDGDAPPTFDLAAYQALRAGDAGTWSRLQGNAAYSPNKAVFVTTTDPVRSNSGLMFAALNAYVANGNAVLDDPAQVAAVAPGIQPLFSGQGYMESSTEGPFENYLATGKQSTPLLLAYESQLLSRQLAGSPEVRDDMVVLYPEPGMFSKHVVVSRTPAGEQVADLLARDDSLTGLEADHGFRPQSRPGALDDAVEAAGLPPLLQVNNAVDPSRYSILSALADAVDPEAAGQSVPAPSALATAPEVRP